MKSVIFSVAMLFAFSANATNSCGNNGNNCGSNGGTNTANGGQGGDGGTGIGLAIAGASSAAEAKANAAAIAAQQQGQQQGQAQGQQQSSTSGVKNSGNSVAGVVGSGNSGGNKVSGNSTSVSVGGDNYEAAASSVIAAPIPTVPTSCRLYMFGGGTNVNGAVSGSVPLGNDQTCLSGVNINNMERTNKAFPSTFSKEDYLKQVCKVEGMDAADACKALEK